MNSPEILDAAELASGHVTLWDVIIAGGGLAGLGLAKQLKQANPELSIVVVEKQGFPRPRAIAKVGESTVEIGSHYLSHHLGLLQHLKDKHLKKFGIRIFFGEPADDFSRQDELGASQTFGIPTYQIDRGDIENHLAAELQALGVTLIDKADILQLDVRAETGTAYDKQLVIRSATVEQTLRGHWLVDTAGRASLLKNHLKLAAKNEHKSNAVWFRIDRTITLDDWCENPEWQARCRPEGRRWLSTNHLVGPGYWVWIIPLASGVTSIGIVMDDIAFDASGIADQTSAMAWLAQHQPRCAAAIGDARFLDFVLLQDYSYDCKQLFSDQRWAIAGEAGLFADPFYSPGSDFIAFANGFICSLITAERRGQDIRVQALVYEKLLRSIYQNTLSLYTGQYGGFGDRVMMGLKLLWDYSYYWGVLSLLYFRDALCDFERIRPLAGELQKAQQLNQSIQALFRTRAERRLQLPNRGVFMDQYQIPCLQFFNKVLMEAPVLPLPEELARNMALVEQVAAAVRDMLGDAPELRISDAERELLGAYRLKILGNGG
ncbi:NAD(P)/FAD-dependent oxidoreductase [Cellvibrio sp. KY-YJ-3]|uniref:NAD(P)/FAD-dependent oxidoreductase n=1 Tax=Cellvibrio sp. KY-YJ-3 TaxID=454662 RepID=UPI001246A758|nr:tryptophan 7-halogenase [Cellvibrio sp. KY-YJ-3]QEY11851.1 halogenase [Cellvibrio sp. KY-YJ-3]